MSGKNFEDYEQGGNIALLLNRGGISEWRKDFDLTEDTAKYNLDILEGIRESILCELDFRQLQDKENFYSQDDAENWLNHVYKLIEKFSHRTNDLYEILEDKLKQEGDLGLEGIDAADTFKTGIAEYLALQGREAGQEYLDSLKK